MLKKIIFSLSLILFTLALDRLYLYQMPKTEIVSLNLTGIDGYKFETSEFFRKNIKLKIVYHPSYTDLQLAGLDSKLAAFTLVRSEKETCEVHVVDPRVAYAPEYLGHEIYHCIHGNWHPSI